MTCNIRQGQQTHYITSLLPVAISISEVNAVFFIAKRQLINLLGGGQQC